MLLTSAQRPMLLALLWGLLPLATLCWLHRYPQTVFYQEWWCALGFVVLGVLWCLRGERAALRLSPAALALVIAIVVGGVRGGAGGGLSASVAWLSYSGLAFMVLLLAQSMANPRQYGDLLVRALATGLVVCGLLQALAGLAQVVRWELPWVMTRLYLSIYGNVAQANHFANLLWLALASLLYLWHTRRAATVLALPAAVLLCALAAVSASRSVWLFSLAVPLLALIQAWRGGQGGRRLAVGAIVLLVLAGLAQVWVASGFGLGQTDVVSSASRASDVSSNGQRMFDWQVAVKLALAHPFGTGFGSFGWQTGVHAIGLSPTSFIRIGENAHNTPLHFAAELGLVPALLIVGLLVWWVLRQLRAPVSPERGWALGIVAVIGLHCLVEYPLWYTYFVIPFFAAIGVADAQDERGTRAGIGRWSLMPLLLVAIAMLAWSWHDYRRLETAYLTLEDASRDVSALEAAGRAINPHSMFAPHAGALRIRNWQEENVAQAGEIAALCRTALPAKTSLQVLEPCVSALALAGDLRAAQQVVDIICGAFPAIFHTDMARRVEALRARAIPLRACTATA